MGTIARKQREKAARRRAIQRAALRCFRTRGYDATTLDDVARAAEVAKGTVYLYFSGKADLFASLLQEHGFDVFAERLEEELAGCRTAGEALAAFARCYRELCLEGKGAVFELFVQLDRGDIARDLSPEVRAAVRARLERILERVAAILDEGRARGELGGPPGRRGALSFWALCVGVAHLAKGASLPEDLTARDVLEDGTALLVAGLEAAAKGARRT